MKLARRKWFSLWADLAIRLSPNRPDRDDQAQRQRRFTYEDQVAAWPLRFTGFLRDRLRRRWLRMHREPHSLRRTDDPSDES